jgi:hypothetical protein
MAKSTHCRKETRRKGSGVSKRRSYTKPQLTTFGNIERITQGTGRTGGDGGGTHSRP